jgi:ABC-type glutathione transport system ATPase component
MDGLARRGKRGVYRGSENALLGYTTPSHAPEGKTTAERSPGESGAQPGDPIVEVKDLSKSFPKKAKNDGSRRPRFLRARGKPRDEFVAVDQVSFSIQEGEIFGLLDKVSGSAILLYSVGKPGS